MAKVLNLIMAELVAFMIAGLTFAAEVQETIQK